MASKNQGRTNIEPGDAISAGSTSGRALQRGPAGSEPGHRGDSRGSSLQGELQKAKGAPQGANQGGAPRGTSRLEPSHAHNAHHTSKHALNQRRERKS